jgi:hypothetical protein
MALQLVTFRILHWTLSLGRVLFRLSHEQTSVEGETMSFEFRLNPNLRPEIKQKVQDTLDRMKGSDFTITDSLHAIFACDGNFIFVTFVSDGKQVGERFSFARSQAANLGQQLIESGSWNDFPFSGIPVDDLKNFGQRLRDYGLNGS